MLTSNTLQAADAKLIWPFSLPRKGEIVRLSVGAYATHRRSTMVQASKELFLINPISEAC